MNQVSDVRLYFREPIAVLYDVARPISRGVNNKVEFQSLFMVPKNIFCGEQE